MNPLPKSCRRCRHHFAPETPDVCHCPKCDTLCSFLEVPAEPQPIQEEECPLTPAERARWRIWFWLLLLLGPGLLLLWMFYGMYGLPYLSNYSPLMLMGTPIVAALGAAFCLARSHGTRRNFTEWLAFMMGMTVLLLYAEVAILFGGCSVLNLLLQ